MVTITIVCIGKCKEKYWRDACAEYAKRLTGFCRFSIVELEESRVPERASAAQIEQALQEEGKRILSKAGDAALVSLCIEGKGLSEEVKRASRWKLSMSPMTFPHQLARVMLCEQIYRAFQIAQDGKYHK